jgi:hypothetical protein
MFNFQPASIDAARLQKGQSISGEIVWNYFAIQKPETYHNWLHFYGSEELAKASRLPQVLVQVRDWIARERSRLNLPDMVMNTTNGSINILTDEQASKYLDDQGNQGLRKFARATRRLITAVDENFLSPSEKRKHENRINRNAFIAAAVTGSQKQLQVLQKNKKPIPKIDPQ